MARRSGTGRMWSYLLAGTAMVVSLGSEAQAEFPGEVWSVSYVRVSGNAPSDVASSVSLGLSEASNIYFYGDSTTRIDATVTGTNAVDLKIIDLASGKTVASRQGLPFDGSGDVSGSVSRAALAWMESLNCAEGCALAVAGPAAQPAPTGLAEVAPLQAPTPKPEPEPVEIAQAPTPEPEPTPEPIEVARAPVPEPVKPEPAKPVPAPQAVEAPKPVAPKAEEKSVPEIVLALPTPEVTTPAPTAPVAQAEVKPPETSSGFQGLDADEVLAAIKTPATPKPSAAAAAPSASTESAGAPSLVALPAPSEDNTLEVATPAKPAQTSTAVASAPKAENSPAVALVPPTPSVPTPNIPTAAEIIANPEIAAAVPEDAIATPSAPEVTEPEPVVAAIATPETPSVPEVAAPSEAESPTVTVTEPEPTATPTPPPAAPAETEAPTQVVEAEPAPIAQPEPAPAPQSEPEAEVAVAVPTPDATPEPEAPAPAAAVPNVTEAPQLVNPAPAGGVTVPDQQLALANPSVPQVPAIPSSDPAAVTTPDGPAVTGDDDQTVNTRLAAVDQQVEGPTLANARWIGFTPAVYTGADTRPGAWIAGPFDRKQRTGWITDTATGNTTRVTFYWREASSGGRTATLSSEAATALGVGRGDVANVAVYLPR